MLLAKLSTVPHALSNPIPITSCASSCAMDKPHDGRWAANERTVYSRLLGNFSKVQHSLQLWPRLIPFTISLSNHESFSNYVYLHSYNIELTRAQSAKALTVEPGEGESLTTRLGVAFNDLL